MTHLLSRHVDATEAEVWSRLHDVSRQESVPRSHVQHRRVTRQQLREVTRQNPDSSTIHSVLMREVQHQRRRRPRMLAKKLERIVCTPSVANITPGMVSRSVDR